MKKNLYLFTLILSVFINACTEQLPGVSPYSGESELVELKFLKVNNPSLDSDFTSTFDGQSINIELPKGTDIRSLIPTFQLSDKATLEIAGEVIESGKTVVNFSTNPSFNIVAQNKTNTKYFPSILLIGVSQDFEANTKTSYQNYIKNNLYIDLSTAIPKTFFNASYFEDAYNARAYGDFDKDGDLDIIAAVSNTYGTESVEIEYFKNDVFSFKKDQSVFANEGPTMLNARKAITVDLDKNGWLDVVMVGSGFDRSPYAGETIKILMNFDGKFTARSLNIGKGYFASVTAGDIDNDGDIDLFVTDNKAISKFLLNDGAGNFVEDLAVYPSDLWGKPYFASELYDINNDGYLDLVTGGHEHNGANTIILLGNASGNFMTSRMVAIPPVSGFGVVVDINFIDYDGDGKTDVLITRTGDGKLEQGYYKGYYLQLLKNTGDNKFEDVTKTALQNNADQGAKRWINIIRIQDVDGDGDLDITTDDKLYGLSWINNNGVFSRK